VSIPESDEVIDRWFTRITKLWLRAIESGEESDLDELENCMFEMNSDQLRSRRVSLLLGKRIVEPVLAVPLAEGFDTRRITFEYDHEPLEFEIDAQDYLNYLLDGDVDTAQELFSGILANEDEESLAYFVDLLIRIYWAST
jgi:hypothetical protein